MCKIELWFSWENTLRSSYVKCQCVKSMVLVSNNKKSLSSWGLYSYLVESPKTSIVITSLIYTGWRGGIWWRQGHLEKRSRKNSWSCVLLCWVTRGVFHFIPVGQLLINRWPQCLVVLSQSFGHPWVMFSWLSVLLQYSKLLSIPNQSLCTYRQWIHSWLKSALQPNPSIIWPKLWLPQGTADTTTVALQALKFHTETGFCKGKKHFFTWLRFILHLQLAWSLAIFLVNFWDLLKEFSSPSCHSVISVSGTFGPRGNFGGNWTARMWPKCS